ncbi:MAG: TRAP transporter substrate-binding protein [Clostridia bacterium]|nr:TRAP transporter substrate-binding protein [Clostridia bacterium]
MKTMIRMIAVILSLVLILTMMTACGGNDIEPVDEDVEKKETIEMSLATVYNAKAPQTLGADKFKELIEERSGGSIKVNVFPNGSLGNEKDNYNQLAAGELEMILAGTQGVDQYASEFAFFGIPYLFRSWDHLGAVLEGDVGQKLKARFEEQNIRMLQVCYRGIRNTTSNKPFETVSELEGLKLRLPELASWVATWKELGASPAPIPLPELYTALQTKVVDASEGPYEQIATFKLYEVQDYVINTSHVYEPVWLFVSQSYYDGLSEEHQKLIDECSTEAMDWATEMCAKQSGEFLQELKDNGMTIIEPDVDEFMETAKPVLEKMFKDNWQVTSYEEIMSYKK